MLISDLSIPSQLIPLSLCTHAEISKPLSTMSEAFSNNLLWEPPPTLTISLPIYQLNAEHNKEAHQESTIIRIHTKMIFMNLNPLILELF